MSENNPTLPVHEIRQCTEEELAAYHAGLKAEFDEYQERSKKFAEQRKQMIADAAAAQAIQRPEIPIEIVDQSPSEE